MIFVSQSCASSSVARHSEIQYQMMWKAETNVEMCFKTKWQHALGENADVPLIVHETIPETVKLPVFGEKLCVYDEGRARTAVFLEAFVEHV